ncbi:MAG: T9SS type A sorting domain-containing protein [Dysgonamonadaceae bacterium]|jgi:hypothetical protein|nr:T9SS type A sorting domain-containing protein [Dysgonamonadaceae bacterium]
MKRNYTLLLVLLSLNFSVQAQFVSEGNQTVYTFESLSALETSGVVKNGNIYTVNNDLTISSTDTLKVDNQIIVKLTDKVTIYVEGQADFAPVDTAVFTRSDEAAAPKGIYFRKDDATVNIRNITFESGGVRFTKGGTINVNNCTFTLINKALGTFALGLGNNTANISYCNFISNQGPAIANGANIITNLVFDHNYLFDNNTANTNAPQMNLSCIEDSEMTISNNTLIGTGRTMVGGLGVSNMLASAGSHHVTIESNYITKHRYGITITGDVPSKILNNELIDNKYDLDPMSGGSGINLYMTSNAIVTGNLIEDHLWGITIVGGNGNINLGKFTLIEDNNPGQNVFKDNGNNDVLYDLYNNSAHTVYAQGNRWNVEVQDAEYIEEVIFHKYDDPSLGEVIYWPAAPENAISTIVSKPEAYFDYATRSLIVNTAFSQITIYDATGKRVLETTRPQATFALPELSKGIHFARITAGNKVSVIKFIY